DPDISTRRKVAFLLSTLLAPTESNSSSTYTSNLHTPDSARVPVHANSHAVHLTNPDQSTTSPLALEAVKKQDILLTVIEGLTNPLPHGQDGDIEGADAGSEEKGVGFFQRYAVNRDGDFSHSQKKALKGWVEKEKDKNGGGGENGLAERWGIMTSTSILLCTHL
ncbi:hypothetical protein K435DRAFT_889761, partial [Dendrothele bispora CBS 962.96]